MTTRMLSIAGTFWPRLAAGGGAGASSRLRSAAAQSRLFAWFSLVLVGCCVALTTVASAAPPPAFRPLPELDPTRVTVDQFADDELDLLYYLAHFGRVAGSVVEAGPDRGYIELPVWRTPSAPFNARVMENIVALAYFYATPRPWNPYHAAPGVRDRLEAALRFWLRLPSPEGALPQYAPGNYDLAATSFGALALVQAVRLLETERADVDAALLREVKVALRKSILHLLENDRFFGGAKDWTNQYSAVWPTALLWLQLEPGDTMVERRFRQRLVASAASFQSPAGYVYEAGGPDWAYTVRTHFNNTAHALQLTADPEVRAVLLEETRRFVEWLAYNAVPAGERWALNTAIQCRTYSPFLEWDYGLPDAQAVPLARAFVPSQEERQRALVERRRQLAARWPQVDELKHYGPRVFIMRGGAEPWLPTAEEKRAAAAQVPVNARTHFVHQRMDDRRSLVFTYVRRPAYYAAFASGQPVSARQRFGLTLLWTGERLIRSDPTPDQGWGTFAAGQHRSYEAEAVDASYSSGKPTPGVRDLDAEVLTVEYALGDLGRKRIVFKSDAIEVTVEHRGAFLEVIPPAMADRVWQNGKPVDGLPLSGNGRLEYRFQF